MSQFEQWEYVNLLAGAGKFQVNGGLFARDVNGNRLGLHVYHGNDKAALSGTVQGIAKFPPNSDNIEKFEFTGEIGQNGSDVWVDLPKECYYYPGPMTVAIRLVNGDSRTVLATFSGHVNDITDGTPTVPPQSLPDNIEDFIVELEGMKSTVETAAAKVDDMANDVDDLKSSLTNLFGDVNAQNITVKDGYYFGYDHGDRTSSGFEKLTFNTTFGYIYYIEATTTENLPLFKCGTLYFPALARSESANAERIGCYFIGNGATVSVNAITAQGYIIRECVTPVADTTLYNLPNISASLKQIQNMIYREFEVSTLANAAVDGAGNIISFANNTLYYCCVTGLKKINVSKGSVYAFFYSLPAVGAKSYNGARTVQTLDNTDINVPDGVTYFAVKHTAKPTITVPDSNIISSFAQKTITTTDFDCDTFERNIAYTVGANGITIATNHVPVNGFSGNIFTIGMPQNLAFETQIAFNRNQTVYIRNYYTSWSEWAELAVKSMVDSEIESVNKFYNLLVGQPYTDTVMCIGDSLTRGQTYKSASESYLNKYNYPYFLKAKYFSDATTVSNIARPGYSAKEIWDNLYSNIAAIPDNSLIFCLIGTNEGLTDTVSTDCAGEDISNYNGNTNTGCYGKIVKTLLTKSCKVVLVTPWKSSGTMPTTLKAINDLGAKWNLPVCALSEAMFPDALRTMDGYTDVVHLNAIGYSKLADEIYFGTCKALTNSYCPDFLPEESQ